MRKPRNLLSYGADFGCGGRIRTCDLQVMSLTSYRTAPPREDQRAWPRAAGRKATGARAVGAPWEASRDARRTERGSEVILAPEPLSRPGDDPLSHP
jgi:hypothetical protein